MAAGAAGARGYRLYQPPAVLRTERLPLLVMLHGCAQDAQALADSSRIDRIAARAARHCPDHVLQTARAEAGQSAYLSTVRWRTQALR